ncbi:MAG: GyrI-like domain-containing protein [Nitrosomonadales bacterium]
MEWRKTSGLSPVESSKTFGIAYDNPDTTEPDKFRFDICGSVTEDIPDNPQGVRNSIIPEGRCAVVRHLGSHDRIERASIRYTANGCPKVARAFGISVVFSLSELDTGDA